MPKVSVLVPVYNVEQYLGKCMDSIVGQTLRDIEIICINDGSTDASLRILQEYAERDARIKIIDKENSGYGKSMNIGLKAASGEYVGIIESDDFAEANMFEELYGIAEEHDIDIVKSDFMVYKDGRDTYSTTIAEYYYNKVLSPAQVPTVFDLNPSIWSNLYRREFLLKNDIWFNETPGASFQDVAFRIKVFACADKVFFLNKAFLHYRRDNPNASVRCSSKLFFVCDEYDEVERFFSARPELIERYQYFLPYWRFGHYAWNYFDRWLTRDSKMEFLNRMYDEYKAMERAGKLKEAYWGDWQWRDIQLLLKNRERFFYNSLIQEQVRDIRRNLLENLCSKRNKNDKLIIYGAGQVGTALAKTLQENDVKIDCFAVTTMAGNASKVQGIPVVEIQSLEKDKETCLIFVATTVQTQAKIVYNLCRQGFRHVVALSSEMRSILQC